MSLYKPRSVEQEPQAILRDWQVFEVNISALGEPTRHFAGFNLMTCDGRVSSPIIEYDVDVHLGVTRSGRVYKLDGNPGVDAEARYVWGVWCRANGIDPDACKDVSSEYV